MQTDATAGGTFPADFLWGAATSSHQVEGDNRCNDWWSFEQSARLPFQSLDCCDHYRRYEEDLALASSLGHTCHRFSIEWSRVEPAPGEWNMEALDHYARVIAAVRARGMEPMVTLQHFTLPAWFAAAGGWEQADSPQLFARFVRRFVEQLDQPVKFWLTINEPTVYVLQAYINGAWPPQRRQAWLKAARVLLNLARAHVLAFDAIKQFQPTALVSFAHSALVIQPCDQQRRADRIAARLRDLLLNRLFFRLIGSPDIGGDGGKLDFIGINYYTRCNVTSTGGPLTRLLGRACKRKHHEGQGAVSDIGWEIYPSGLQTTLRRFGASGLPLFITENGIATQDDELRCQFLQDHIAVLEQAMAEGADVMGYLHWSLMDNFEWDQGTAARFGLIKVDYSTQTRTPRRSARMLTELLQAGEVQTA